MFVLCHIDTSFQVVNHAFFYREHLYVSRVLNDLSVWQEAPIPGGLQGWILSAVFKRNLKIALLGGYVATLPLLESFLKEVFLQRQAVEYVVSARSRQQGPRRCVSRCLFGGTVGVRSALHGRVPAAGGYIRRRCTDTAACRTHEEVHVLPSNLCSVAFFDCLIVSIFILGTKRMGVR